MVKVDYGKERVIIIMKKNMDEIIISNISSIFMIIIGIIALFPVVTVVAKSLSSDSAVLAGKVILWPVDFQVETYRYVLTKLGFMSALKSSIIVTVIGTVLALIVTILLAYPLSREDFKGRKIISWYIMITMIFEAGFVPNYLLMRSLKLLDTYWSLILPFLVVGFYAFLLKNYMEGLPIEIIESVRIDGASHYKLLLYIVLPLSKPVIASVALFQAVIYWNNYTNAMMYINSVKLLPLPNYLLNVMTLLADPAQLPANKSVSLSEQVVSSATVVATMLPIIMLYPYVQKYYTKGVTLGAVKG
jgi:putative aldouronate transport system permease protein